MKKATCLILTCLILASCVAKKEVTKDKVKSDSIIVENNTIKIDTIYKERIVYNTEFFTNDIEIPCDSSKFNQSIQSGKMGLKVIKEKGKINISFKKDSSRIICENEYKVLTRENDSLKSKISSLTKTETKEVIKEPFFSGFWKIAFFILLVLFLVLLILWILGITPRTIFKSIARI